MQRATDTQTDTQMRVTTTTIHFASPMTHAKCNKQAMNMRNITDSQ